MRKRGLGTGIVLLLAIVLVAVAALLGWAWIDGGAERVHRIEVPVAVPEIKP